MAQTCSKSCLHQVRMMSSASVSPRCTHSITVSEYGDMTRHNINATTDLGRAFTRYCMSSHLENYQSFMELKIIYVSSQIVDRDRPTEPNIPAVFQCDV